MDPQAKIHDDRTRGERAAWSLLGPPLYYCEDCLRQVKVSGDPPVVKRTCIHDGKIIAPRRAIVAGEGGLSPANKAKMAGYKIAAALTGRSV